MLCAAGAAAVWERQKTIIIIHALLGIRKVKSPEIAQCKCSQRFSVAQLAGDSNGVVFGAWVSLTRIFQLTRYGGGHIIDRLSTDWLTKLQLHWLLDYGSVAWPLGCLAAWLVVREVKAKIVTSLWWRVGVGGV